MKQEDLVSTLLGGIVPSSTIFGNSTADSLKPFCAELVKALLGVQRRVARRLVDARACSTKSCRGKLSSVVAKMNIFARDAKVLTGLSKCKTLQTRSRDIAQLIVDSAYSFGGESHIKSHAVHVTGMGKSGYVGQRMAASLCSVSVKSKFTHATEWGHGDLGQLRDSDIIVCLSNSGKSKECIEALSLITEKRTCTMIGIHSNLNGPLDADHIRDYCNTSMEYPLEEADLLNGRLPSASIIAQEACVNAILYEIINIVEFTEGKFIYNHPN